MKDVRRILKDRILVLDGAMGTMIQRYNLQEADFRNEKLKNHSIPLKGNNDLLSVTRPDIIKVIHAEYLQAGSDIIETNSFGATSVAQDDYQLAHWVYDINYQAASIARVVADEFTAKEPDKPRFVAGSMGPTTKTASLSPDVNDPGFRSVSFDDLAIAFKEQAGALLDGGADFLLIETITDTLNSKAALFAAQQIMDERNIEVPVMISGTITDASGRTLTGQTTEAFLISVSHVPLLSIGLNCALGAKDLQQYLHVLSDKSSFFTSAHPNAGLPNEFGEYDQTPEQMAKQIKEYLDEGLVNIVGGCCGTTPAHIRLIADLAHKAKPRNINKIVLEEETS